MNQGQPAEGRDDTRRSFFDSGDADGALAAASMLGVRIGFLVLCALGALLSAELLRLHVRVHTDPNYHSLCAISEAIDCESVAFSSYAVAAGLPIALWGLMGYLFMGGLCIWGIRGFREASVWPFGILFWLSLLASLISVLLFSVSVQLIGSLCIFCMAIYGVNLLLWGVTIVGLIRLKIGPVSALRKEIQQWPGRGIRLMWLVLSLVGVIVILKIAMPQYWHTELTTGPGGVLTGRNAEGAFWIGARKPAIEISEFSDYQCPYCFRGHVRARELVFEHPDRVRLVHLHFPLKQHPHAFQYAKMAYCAGEQGRFWEANDFLFAHGRRSEPVTPQEVSATVGLALVQLTACLDREATKEAISKDVALGHSLNVEGTPTFVIDGNMYPGHIPESVLSPLISGGTLSPD